MSQLKAQTTNDLLNLLEITCKEIARLTNTKAPLHIDRTSQGPIVSKLVADHYDVLYLDHAGLVGLVAKYHGHLFNLITKAN